MCQNDVGNDSRVELRNGECERTGGKNFVLHSELTSKEKAAA